MATIYYGAAKGRGFTYITGYSLCRHCRGPSTLSVLHVKKREAPGLYTDSPGAVPGEQQTPGWARKAAWPLSVPRPGLFKLRPRPSQESRPAMFFKLSYKNFPKCVKIVYPPAF